MSSESRPLLEGQDGYKGTSIRESKALYRNFVTMCIAFSVNHGCVVSCLAYATTELGDVTLNPHSSYGSVNPLL